MYSKTYSATVLGSMTASIVLVLERLEVVLTCYDVSVCTPLRLDMGGPV